MVTKVTDYATVVRKRRKRSALNTTVQNPYESNRGLMLTTGQANRQIDLFWHPWFHKGPLPILVDSVLHAMAERNQDPAKSLEKFFRYNFSPLLREALKLYRQSRKRSEKE